jgi:transposase-like protein
MMATHRTLDNNLSPKQRKAIESLLTSGTVADAARAAGVTRDSLYRWLKDEHFARALRDAEGLALEGLTRSLTMLGDKAVAALVAVFDDEAAPHAVKLKAAAIVFGNHPTYLQTTALAERISAIEARQDGGQS